MKRFLIIVGVFLMTEAAWAQPVGNEAVSQFSSGVVIEQTGLSHSKDEVGIVTRPPNLSLSSESTNVTLGPGNLSISKGTTIIVLDQSRMSLSKESVIMTIIPGPSLTGTFIHAPMTIP